MSLVLIVRPQPGADRSAARARRKGLEPVIAPIFTILPIEWKPPAADQVEAVLLTSANAARNAGPGLAGFVRLPCYAVGPATERAARMTGFTDIRTGPGDGAAVLDMAAADGVKSALHPSGRDHVAIATPGVALIRRTVYAAEPRGTLPEAANAALDREALVLLHSSRAAAHFASLADAAGLKRSAIRLVAISPAAAAAAGSGWRTIEIADRPRDEALLELAAKLCKTDADGDEDYQHGI